MADGEQPNTVEEVERLEDRRGRGSGPGWRGARDSAAGLETFVMRLALVLAFSGALWIIAFSLSGRADWRVTATASVILLASSAVGALVGFLFALPREAAAPPGDQTRLRYLSNSNLLKVSDWVTTIIVGLTLVNVRSVGAAVGDLGMALEEPLGGWPQSAAFGVGLVIFGGTGTAVLMYLWTAVRLRQLLERSLMDLDRERSMLDGLGKAGERLKDVLQKGATPSEVKEAVEALPKVVLPTVLEEIKNATVEYDQQAVGGVMAHLESRIAEEKPQ